ncbi:phospholipase A-2-activating protein [Patella vulgata]|uniref:phospholipase A-2-activating protein n=1 Tax=Patella vulgata TaxID=6465 RepID=UPI00218043B3|nr:phospholipase A-2-activating protein [Patella vulgata]
METPYKLRCNIIGHEKDVRVVCSTIFPENGILSGSRDVSARIWVPIEMDNGFQEGHVMRGHSNFVSSVCVMPPDEKYPQGLVFTGSNDSTILAFTLDSPQPIFKLTGHTNTVCALSAGKFGFLLSGSWDKTARVWLNQKTVMTLEGHEAAVWAVATMSEQGVMLTGSADRTIKLWKAGKCLQTFIGHEDCVRGLAAVRPGEFLSCSNDATIKRWLTSGDCIGTYYGHTNYVYSIALLPNGEDFVTSGEDRTVRVWKGSECVQTIPHPIQSVWSVCTLANGDIVSGASDGLIRVFTTCPERRAPEDELQAFEEALAASTIPTQLGDIKMEDLPGPEALINPGRKDGQTKMVKDGDKVQLYNWDASASKWNKVGDIVGSAGGTQATSGKTLYQGKEYDFVFSVDIQEGQPPLKLPYNTSEDPWFAAQRFLDENQLSQLFLDQVANFIVDNTKGVTLGTGGNLGGDPLTSGGRYIPGSGGANGVGTGGGDPFTGSGRHVPSYTDQTRSNASHGADPFTGSGSYNPVGVTKASTTNTYFPVRKCVTFTQSNPAQIMGKLKEFNQSVGGDKAVSDIELESLSTFITGQSSTDQQIAVLCKLLLWPENVIFPALDILRLGMLYPDVNRLFTGKAGFLEGLYQYLSADQPTANQMLALRIIANAFSQPGGLKSNFENCENLLTAILKLKDSSNKNIQIAIATILLNFAVSFFGIDDLEKKSLCICAAGSLLEGSLDNEAAFRLIVCIGTFINDDDKAKVLAVSIDLPAILSKYKVLTEPKKLTESATLLHNCFG